MPQPAVGHYGVFHGRPWQSETYPKVKEFIRTHGWPLQKSRITTRGSHAMIRVLSSLLLLAATPAMAQIANPGGAGYADESRDFGILPQTVLHTGSPHAPTPLTLPGARTITTVQLYGMLSARQPLLLLDVNHPSGAAIQGAHWLDGAGVGTSFNDHIQLGLRRKVDELVNGNKDAAIVVFCESSHCWLSYDVGLRLTRMGYRNVYWYRGGRQAWQAAGLPLVSLTPENW